MSCWAIISDIHSNYRALETVLAAVEKEKPVKIICLGDIVGYGAEPVKTLELLKKRSISSLQGNHEAVVVGKLSAAGFNFTAQKTLSWTRERLSQENIAYLSELPEKIVTDGCYFVHGAPQEPLRRYLLTEKKVMKSMQKLRSRFLITGHTHEVKAVEIVGNESREISVVPGRAYRLKENHRYYFNPGSVGQPRDGDPRPSFMLLDFQTDRVKWIRVRRSVFPGN